MRITPDRTRGMLSLTTAGTHGNRPLPLPVGSTHPPPASGWDWREFVRMEAISRIMVAVGSGGQIQSVL